MDDERLTDMLNGRADRDLGALVAVLDGEGLFDQADLIESGALSYEVEFDINADTFITPCLAVDPLYFPMVKPEAERAIQRALDAMHASGHSTRVCEVRIAPMPAGDDWRELRKAARQPPESRAAANQGNYKPVSSLKRVDGLNFGSDAEIAVYEALKAKQKALPREATIGILPGAAFVGRERRFWPDFIVTHRGRAGAIEVDGPHHHGRAVADRSRENEISDAGVSWVDRIAVEDVGKPDELAAFIETFLSRLLR